MRFEWPAGATVLPKVSVVDVDGVRSAVHVVLDGALIAGVVDATEVIPGDAILIEDARGQWVMPGLVDVHVHLFLSGTAGWVGDTLSAHLRQQLAHGVTSVVDVGGPVESFALRDRVAAGEIVGPSMKTLGPMVTALGSHPCEARYDLEFCRFVDDEASGAAVAVALLDAGGDGVKVAVADADFTPWPTERLSVAALRGAVGAVDAAGAGLSVAHVDEQSDALDALDAGVGHLAHPVFGGELDPLAEGRIAAESIAVHTTLGAFSGTLELLDGTLPLSPLGADPRVSASWALDGANPQWFDPAWRTESQAWLDTATATLLRLEGGGAPVVPASDAGYLYVAHGLGLHLELARLQELGWMPQDLLAGVTDDAAVSAGFDDRGRVAAGLRADLLVLADDPRLDVANWVHPTVVVVAGRAETPAAWASLDVVSHPAAGDAGAFCVDGRDCASNTCDRVAHRCTTSCAVAGQLEDPCGASAWCAPEEGITGPPVCRSVRTCDLYDVGSCAPEPYKERCVPLDLDTSGCFEAGPRLTGQSCDPMVPATACEAGLYCSSIDGVCYELCDPSWVADPCALPRSCVGQVGARATLVRTLSVGGCRPCQAARRKRQPQRFSRTGTSSAKRSVRGALEPCIWPVTARAGTGSRSRSGRPPPGTSPCALSRRPTR